MTLRELLTPRQFEITQWIHEGYSNPEIAAMLRVSPDTIKHVVYMIFDKLGCDNRVQLAVRYERENRE